MKAYPFAQLSHRRDVLGNGDIASGILNLDNRWRWVVSSTPRPFYPQCKSLRYRRLGGPRSCSGRSSV